MKYVVYGGQFGSEGKGSCAEWLLKNRRDAEHLTVFGENSPNSGHTCSLGKTRNLPAASFFADDVILGPDSAIDLSVLAHDLQTIKSARGGSVPNVYIHCNAALLPLTASAHEIEDGLVNRVASTSSGSGFARAYCKQYLREELAVVGCARKQVAALGYPVHILDHNQYCGAVCAAGSVVDNDCLFECSQGVLLDNSWGYYPYVTSRCTLPRVAVERNGLGDIDWQYVGVHRCHPIRTGGNSGPTGGDEIRFEHFGVKPEIATVTGRTRRLFAFSQRDFQLSVRLARPDIIAFTHLDYVEALPCIDVKETFADWYAEPEFEPEFRRPLLLSRKLGEFIEYGQFKF